MRLCENVTTKPLFAFFASQLALPSRRCSTASAGYGSEVFQYNRLRMLTQQVCPLTNLVRPDYVVASLLGSKNIAGTPVSSLCRKKSGAAVLAALRAPWLLFTNPELASSEQMLRV